MNALVTLTLAAGLTLGFVAGAQSASATQAEEHDTLELGNFSVSLAVKDLAASRDFYAKFDFKPVGGDFAQNWLILQNGGITIGLFQGMFEGNILTFNPGWNADKQTLPEFDDVREIQAVLKERGVELITEAEDGDGPAHFTLLDPDGNSILFDQHVPRPER